VERAGKEWKTETPNQLLTETVERKGMGRGVGRQKMSGVGWVETGRTGGGRLKR
jgi:hypothetical protein